MYQVSSNLFPCTCVSLYICCVVSHRALLYYFVSGDTGVQAVTGSAWRDTALRIFCSFEVAAFVRSWLIGPDVHQILSGFSACSNLVAQVSNQCMGFNYDCSCSTIRENEDDVVSHIEFYMNRDDSVTYVMLNNRERQLNNHESFRLTTSDGRLIPCLTHRPKDANISLIVMKVMSPLVNSF